MLRVVFSFDPQAQNFVTIPTGVNPKLRVRVTSNAAIHDPFDAMTIVEHEPLGEFET